MQDSTVFYYWQKSLVNIFIKETFIYFPSLSGKKKLTFMYKLFLTLKGWKFFYIAYENQIRNHFLWQTLANLTHYVSLTKELVKLIILMSWKGLYTLLKPLNGFHKWQTWTIKHKETTVQQIQPKLSHTHTHTHTHTQLVQKKISG